MKTHPILVCCPGCRRPLDHLFASADRLNQVKCCRRVVKVPTAILDVLRARALDEATP